MLGGARDDYTTVAERASGLRFDNYGFAGIGPREYRELILHSMLPRDLEHWYDEIHHTPKGCELIGRAVADRILARRGEGVSPAPVNG